MTTEEKNKAFKECLERISEKFGRVDFRERLMFRMAFDAGTDLAEPERCNYKHSVADDNGAAIICYHKYGCENCEYKRRCERL